jgi:predicted MPP superfamily phosphohydrolase
VDRRATAAIATAGAAALGAAAWATLVEPRRLRVREVGVDVPGWPEPLADLRVALVSDLHAGAPHVDERRVGRVVDAVNAARPDVVALLGDYVDPEVALGERVEPEAVAERLGRLEAPLGVFAVLGNHDWLEDGERVRHALREQRIEVLENDTASVDLAGQVLWVVGLADAITRTPDVSTPFALVPESAPLIVLTHDPDVFPKLPDRPLLALAGHTHGGQVNIPVVRDKVTPSMYGDHYAGGLFEEGERVMYVSRGIGTSSFPIRFGAVPEVVMLTLAGSARQLSLLPT